MANIIILLISLILGGITLYFSIDDSPVAFEPIKKEVQKSGGTKNVSTPKNIDIEYKLQGSNLEEELASLPEDIANQNRKVRLFIEQNQMFSSYDQNYDEARFNDKNGSYVVKVMVKNPNVKTTSFKKEIMTNITTPDGTSINAKIDPELIDTNENVYLLVTNTTTKKEQLVNITKQLNEQVKNTNGNVLSITYSDNDSGISVPSDTQTKSFTIKQPPSIPDEVLKKLGITE